MSAMIFYSILVEGAALRHLLNTFQIQALASVTHAVNLRLAIEAQQTIDRFHNDIK